MGKKDEKSSLETTATKRKKRKVSVDENTFIGIEEPASKYRRIKITRVKKENGKGHRKKLTKATVLSEVNLNHASPKIWDIFERFQSFAQRKVLTRHPSGLLEASNDDKAKEKPELDAQLDKNDIRRQTTEPHPESDNESPMGGGDRKRRCVEISNYEDELQTTGKREPQPKNILWESAVL